MASVEQDFTSQNSEMEGKIESSLTDVYERYTKVHKLLVNSSPSANLSWWDVICYSIVTVGELRIMYPAIMKPIAALLASIAIDSANADKATHLKDALLSEQNKS